MTFYAATHGLTSAQAWTQAHIQRCPQCGAWECITNLEAMTRCAPGYISPTVCEHLNPDQHRKWEAA